MAYTATNTAKTIFGNENVWQGTVTADAASGSVTFGYNTITHIEWSAQSATTTGVRFRINALASGTAAAGTLGISGAASGDVYYVTVYGR